jgi:hypothetical protein
MYDDFITISEKIDKLIEDLEALEVRVKALEDA